MFEKIRKKIESKRNSGNIFWEIIVFIKDCIWTLFEFLKIALVKVKIYFLRKKLFWRVNVDKNITLLPLLEKEEFSKIFENFKNKSIGFVRMSSSTGDMIIEDAAMQMFTKFNVSFKEINKRPNLDVIDLNFIKEVDEFAFNGGGCMGNFYFQVFNLRMRFLEYKKPITVLPQTFVLSRDDANYEKVWIRETESLKFREDAFLAPDLALGYEYYGDLPKPKYKIGVWLRQDDEAIDVGGVKSLGDPALICKNTKEYIWLASLYEKIITNRLHFAIIGLIARREVVLLPNSYFKNYSMWKTWLKDLGCKWSDIKTIEKEL